MSNVYDIDQYLMANRRERVKRAKRADSKERKEGDTGSEAPLSRVEGQNQEALKSQNPNLSDLSKGLPAGWQVIFLSFYTRRQVRLY